MYFDQFRARRLKTADHHLAHSLEELVAERKIVVAGFTKSGSVEKKRSRRFGGSSVELPQIRREEPRPSEWFARDQDVDFNLRLASNRSFNMHASAFDKKKTARFFAGAKDEVAALELHERRRTGQEFDVMRTHPGEEWMGSDKGAQISGVRFHGDFLCNSAAVYPGRIFIWPVCE